MSCVESPWTRSSWGIFWFLNILNKKDDSGDDQEFKEIKVYIYLDVKGI